MDVVNWTTERSKPKPLYAYSRKTQMRVHTPTHPTTHPPTHTTQMTDGDHGMPDQTKFFGRRRSYAVEQTQPFSDSTYLFASATKKPVKLGSPAGKI